LRCRGQIWSTQAVFADCLPTPAQWRARPSQFNGSTAARWARPSTWKTSPRSSVSIPQDKYHHRSYANIASVLWAENCEAGAYEFFRRLVFSVLIGNGDMHLKNWSLLYPDGRTPVLSPACDLVATFPYIPNDSLALTFGGSRSLSEIDRRPCAAVCGLRATTRKPVVEACHRRYHPHGCCLEAAS